MAIAIANYSCPRSHMGAYLDDLDVRLSSHQEEQSTENFKIDGLIAIRWKKMQMAREGTGRGNLKTLEVQKRLEKAGRYTSPVKDDVRKSLYTIGEDRPMGGGY